MTKISKTEYRGNLRTVATHLRSQNQIVTDAPIDNNGQGAAFSPTDLVATALSCCMITLMGIAANTNNFLLGDVKAETEKIMGSNPRRISEIVIKLHIDDTGYSNREKAIIERAALSCPVAKSLSESLVQTISFEYVKV